MHVLLHISSSLGGVSSHSFIEADRRLLSFELDYSTTYMSSAIPLIPDPSMGLKGRRLRRGFDQILPLQLAWLWALPVPPRLPLALPRYRRRRLVLVLVEGGEGAEGGQGRTCPC